jgi:hypothetical protein
MALANAGGGGSNEHPRELRRDPLRTGAASASSLLIALALACYLPLAAPSPEPAKTKTAPGARGGGTRHRRGGQGRSALMGHMGMGRCFLHQVLIS